MNREPIGPLKQLRGRAVVTIRHALTNPVSRLVSISGLRHWHRLRRRANPQRYTDASPLALLQVDPNRIERSLIETAPGRPQWGRVVGGDWDRDWELFDDRQVPRGLTQRFEEGKPWKETALYDAYVGQLKRFGNAWEYTSIKEFEQRCREIEQLYEAIKQDGYRVQTEIREQETAIGTRADEINVDIGRDGTIYWRTYGQHRLAIAKLLDIETVPVIVQRRHREWQRVRDRVRKEDQTAVDEEYHAHPDLSNFGDDGAE